MNTLTRSRWAFMDAKEAERLSARERYLETRLRREVFKRICFEAAFYLTLAWAGTMTALAIEGTRF